MLDGVTPFPAEFAARYRELGYWEDRPLFDGFTAALAAHADRVAVVDEAGPVTYRELDERSQRLARVLLDHGFKPLDRIIVQLPNSAVFGSWTMIRSSGLKPWSSSTRASRCDRSSSSR